MALLYRASRLHDRDDTHVFTFIVTRSATRDPDRTVTSKEFCAAHQRWAVALSRRDAALGVFLVWRGAGDGMRVYADFTFTLLAREHFSANESFSGRQVRFSAGGAAHGRGRCVPLADLSARFLDARGEFQLELGVARVRSVFSCELRAPRLDSPPLAFGGFDWSVAVGGGGREPLALRLLRLSGAGQRVRVRYALALGEGARRVASGPLEHEADAEGRAPAWTPPGGIPTGPLRLTLQLLAAAARVEVAVAAGGRPSSCYDRERQAWALRCDTQSETVRLHMLYRDVQHVPRNHLRYVSWTAWLLRGPVAEALPGAPFAHYYAQENADEGVMMETALRVEELRGSELAVRVEWGDSHVLFQATYHVYDDLCRLHAQQMRAEMLSLRADNAALERRLAGCRRRSSSPGGSPGSPPERDVSTDTEYA